MTTTFSTTGDWYVEGYESQEIIEKVIETSGNGEQTGYLTSSIIKLATIYRKCIGLCSFTSQVGDTSLMVPGGKTGPDTTVSAWSSTDKWRCTGDDVKVTNTITGACQQRQTWELKLPPEKIEDSEFSDNTD